MIHYIQNKGRTYTPLSFVDIGSYNGSLIIQRQTITWASAYLFSIGLRWNKLRTSFNLNTKHSCKENALATFVSEKYTYFVQAAAWWCVWACSHIREIGATDQHVTKLISWNGCGMLSIFVSQNDLVFITKLHKRCAWLVTGYHTYQRGFLWWPSVNFTEKV